MYNVAALIFKYLFIIIIYAFILSIIRLIYLDIRAIDKSESKAYLKLMNMKDDLPFKIYDYYPIKKQTSLGRGSDNDIVIKDPFISKNHLVFMEKGASYYLKDLDSANGTYLNDEKIDNIMELYNGDIIKIGQISFVYVNKE